MRSLAPLTDEERRLAEKYHGLVGQFLAHNRLDPAEYYDVAVFGLLRLVQAISQGHLQEGPSISKLAHENMRWEVSCYRHHNRRQKRSGWKIVHMEDEASDRHYYVRLRGEMIADHRQNTARQVERRDLMERAIAAASPNQRAVMELKVLGFSGGEIARRLGLTESAVKARVFKFQQKARDLLKEEPPACAGNTASGNEKNLSGSIIAGKDGIVNANEAFA